MKMDIAKNYSPANIEDKWYKDWQDKNFFHSEPDDREPFTIVIPPPNVTGVLHMGHMLNNTLQDVLVRRARMQGKNACWLPGTDHASIATESKVVALLKSKGIDKNKIGRDEFLTHAWEWKEKHGGIILEQLKKLGASCDWERTKFTMDDDMSESVIQVFIDLYNKGLIYRGIRMINWDPQAKTAVSDEEVVYTEENSKLYHVRYRIVDSEDYITIATTRPETILGDTAVCVNPNDERYKHLKNKEVIVPMVNRKVPLIFDEYVDMEFGTGALKITPAHDENDYHIGQKHHLASIDIFNDDGTLSKEATLFVGEDRFEARKMAVKLLEENEALVKAEDYQNKVGRSERTNAVIEPKISTQWFLKMDELSKPALEHVMNDDIQFHPAKFKNMYKHWMENVKDWCISRQLWWGHRIPAYYLPNGEFVVAETLEKAYEKALEIDSTIKIDNLKQDEDVLDTWFSSWLWPISTFDGIRNPDNPDIKYYYPTNDLVTAPEIIFFWVARMIIAGYEYRGELPFKNVYFTGIVRDHQRRKMSKSLGNSPDPIELMKKYGADGVRIGMLLSSPAGNDLLFDEQLCEQGRNFNNKIWNAFRLVKGWKVKDIPQPEVNKIAVEWFENKLIENIKIIDDHYDKYRISDALMVVYKLFWDEYSSWYLELIKPDFEKPLDKQTYEQTIGILEKLLKLLHPFVPFISEEIWHSIKQRNADDYLIVARMPVASEYSSEMIQEFEFVKEVVSSIRDFKKKNNISQKEEIELKVLESKAHNKLYDPVLLKLTKLSAIDYISAKPEGAISFLVRTIEYFIPAPESMDVEKEIEKIEADILYQQGFLKTVIKKLGNEKFVANAPEKVVEMERKKKADAESKIKTLEEKLKNLK
jgi:valyl-tRNA synthetase